MSFDYFTTAIRFITSYREIEKAPKSAAHHLIKYTVKDDYTAGHLCQSWDGRKQDFGDFYLNLSNDTRYQILKFWGLSHPEGDKYVESVRENQKAMLWADVPPCIEWPTELLKFFYNHGIMKECEKGITLTVLPADDKCYGNSSNWGDYIFSLPRDEQERVLQLIVAYGLEKRKS